LLPDLDSSVDTTFRRAPLWAALLACTPLHAAPAPESAPSELDRVVVTGQREGYGARAVRSATKTDTLLRDVPQAVTVVNREVIDDQAMTNMVDALRLVPGVGVAQGEGHRDAPIFRGNASTSDMFVDGVRDDVQYIRDLYNVERVEVLKGANAMIFGRGGVGGVINRVTRVADGEAHRELTVQVGEHNRSRGTFDIGQPIDGMDASFRVTGLYEDSESFRDFFELERYGLNPTVTFGAGDATRVTLGYEHFRDERVADRGVPSQLALGIGRPVDVAPGTFFGAPGNSPIRAAVDAFTGVVEHRFAGGAKLTNRSRWADYDRFYQNVYPNGLSRDGSQALIAAYNSSMKRENAFNQTDVVVGLATGGVQHTVLVGAEFGRQVTDNLRISGVFPAAPCDGAVRTSMACVPLANPLYTGPVTFVASPSDANNRSVSKVGALYVQDQIEFSPQWEAVLGLRYDRFEADVRQNRTGAVVSATDDLWSPRVGLIWKPVEPVSIYASYSTAALPRAGEQLASLTPGNAALEPEEFRNYEIGAKVDVNPQLAFTAAVYRLDRTNVAITDPSDPTRSLLVDAQSTEGVELGLAGDVTDAWKVFASYAYQDGRITRPAPSVLPQVPRHSASLWNRYDFTPTWGVGLGVFHRDDVFASSSNRVVLDAFTRVDAAVYYTLGPALRLQLNIENLLDEAYFVNAHNDNNLMPGSPRAAHLTMHLRF
jgi:catecholate siderophore receptor